MSNLSVAQAEAPGKTVNRKIIMNFSFARIVDNILGYDRITIKAEVAELADALRSGRSELYAHVGSTPTFGIGS